MKDEELQYFGVSLKKLIFRGGERSRFTKNQCRGGLGQFADLRGWGFARKRKDAYHNAYYGW